jgi:hypothetical protein
MGFKDVKQTKFISQIVELLKKKTNFDINIFHI